MGDDDVGFPVGEVVGEGGGGHGRGGRGEDGVRAGHGVQLTEHLTFDVSVLWNTFLKRDN